MFQLPARRVWYLSSCDDWVVRIISCSNNDVTFTTQWIIYRQYETSRSGIVSAGYSVGVLGDRSRNCCNWGSAETRNSRRFASSVSRQEIQFSKLSNHEYSDNRIINLSETSLVWLILTDSCSKKKIFNFLNFEEISPQVEALFASDPNGTSRLIMGGFSVSTLGVISLFLRLVMIPTFILSTRSKWF